MMVQRNDITPTSSAKTRRKTQRGNTRPRRGRVASGGLITMPQVINEIMPKTVVKSPPSLQHFGPRGTVGFGYEKSLVVASLMKGILEPMYRCGSTWG